MKSHRVVPGARFRSAVFLCLLLAMAEVSLGQTKSAQIDKLIRWLAQRGQFSGSILVAEQLVGSGGRDRTADLGVMNQ
jgi:hypothetical protein